MAQTITTDGDGERLGESVERVWGPLQLERTAEFGAHAPVCSFVVRPRLGVCLLEAVERDVIGDAAPAHDETPETLRKRLAQCTAFDNPRIVYPKRTRIGNFKYQNDIAVREGGHRQGVQHSPSRWGPWWSTTPAASKCVCEGTCTCTATRKICGCAGPCQQVCALCGMTCTHRCEDLMAHMLCCSCAKANAVLLVGEGMPVREIRLCGPSIFVRCPLLLREPADGDRTAPRRLFGGGAA